MIKHRNFTEVADIDDVLDDEDIERQDRITFFRSRMDGEWYVEFGHRTAGMCSYVAAVFKVNDDGPLEELHGASEMVTVFGEKWSEQ